MPKSLLPESGENMFQRAKAKRAVAEAAGIKVINLSVGDPAGPAPLEACQAAAEAVMSRTQAMHNYQDNGCNPMPDWARRFVNAHVLTNLLGSGGEELGYLPIPGIKPTLSTVIRSCGAWLGEGRPISKAVMKVATMTKPGYMTPATQCKMAKNVEHMHLPMDAKNGFLFSPADIDTAAESELGDVFGEGDLIMLNLPLNPAGIVGTEEWLRDLCGFCLSRGIRLANDGAYAKLMYNHLARTLTGVAVHFPGLEWAEFFSASKLGKPGEGGMTGWRVGVAVGSKTFVGDIRRINGEDNSGFNAALAIGALHYLENCQDQIEELCKFYQERLELLTNILTERGMRLAVKPEAGFFVLFDCPKQAFGQNIADAEQFNELMTNRTGVNGIAFTEGGNWMRYAVCAADVNAFADDIRVAFEKAEVAY